MSIFVALRRCVPHPRLRYGFIRAIALNPARTSAASLVNAPELCRSLIGADFRSSFPTGGDGVSVCAMDVWLDEACGECTHLTISRQKCP